MRTIRSFLLVILIFIGTSLHAQTRIEHIVARGETINSIAEKYNITTEQLLKSNPSAANFVFIGQKLIIEIGDYQEKNHKVETSMTATDARTVDSPVVNPDAIKPVPVISGKAVSQDYNPVESSVDINVILPASYWRENRKGVGGEIAVGVKYYLTDKFFLSSSLGYNFLWKKNTVGQNKNNYATDYWDHNLIVPVLGGITFGSNRDCSIRLGGFIQYTIAGKQIDSSNNKTTTTRYKDLGINRLSYGIQFYTQVLTMLNLGLRLTFSEGTDNPSAMISVGFSF